MMKNRPPIPALRYEDAPNAIGFLGRAFGFTPRVVFRDNSYPDIVVHAQLDAGEGMIMLSSAQRDEGPSLYGWKTAREAGGVTMSVCLVVDDPDAHHERARGAGAEIIKRPYDNTGFPGRSYEARDPEGNVWNFTTYDPWS